jgi:hypothetical protein
MLYYALKKKKKIKKIKKPPKILFSTINDIRVNYHGVWHAVIIFVVGVSIYGSTHAWTIGHFCISSRDQDIWHI